MGVRILWAVALVLLVVTLVFVVMRIIPGDPVAMLGGGKISDEMAQRWRHELGLDKPIHIQYLLYMTDIFRGDLGYSWETHAPVMKQVLFYFPSTLELIIAAEFFAIVIGFFTGVLAALKRNRLADHGVRLFTIAGVSLPVFWVALMLQLLVGVKLGIAPVYGSISPLLAPPRVTGLDVIDSLIACNWAGLVDSLSHLVLPAISLGLYIAAYISRMTRSNLIEEFSQEYIVTARAKGLPKKMIVYKHALRNAMLPIMTIAIYQFAYLLGGSTVTELVFSWPGLGSYFYHALSVRDFPLLQGMMVFIAIVLAFFTVLMDVLNYYFDPRVRVG